MMCGWQNGLTGAWVYFCGRFCAGKWGASWVVPEFVRHRCEVCS